MPSVKLHPGKVSGVENGFIRNLDHRRAGSTVPRPKLIKPKVISVPFNQTVDPKLFVPLMKLVDEVAKPSGVVAGMQPNKFVSAAVKASASARMLTGGVGEPSLLVVFKYHSYCMTLREIDAAVCRARLLFS